MIGAALGLVLMLGSDAWSQDMQSFDLPACARDAATDVVLNDRVLDAMIEAAATGVRPDRQQEKFFIVLQHYLGSSGNLLFVSRTAGEGLVLWREDCEPDPSADTHVQAYVSGLTAQQQLALVTYRDLVATFDVEPAASEMPLMPSMGDMVRIPAGAFQRSDGTTAALEAFAIDVYEVTNAEYQRFIAGGGYAEASYWLPEGWAWRESKKREQPSYWNNEDFNAVQQPVVGVTWYEADAYCRWAGKSLPEEPQWDKACRGIDGRAFPWGSEPLAGEGTGQSSFILPVAVGDMPQTPSPYGVYDLAGNVLEWSGTTNDRGGRVLCGGSGASDSRHVGCGVRSVLLPGVSANFVGFRCQQAAAQ
jgi:formylglycine-generating enzyme required for sulfatase activity